MPLENTSRSPRRANWRGRNPSSPEDRGQDREAVEGGVRGEHQDRGGERLHREEADRVVAEHRAGDLGDDRALGVAGRGTDQLGGVCGDVHVADQRQGGDADEHGDGQPTHDGQRGGGVAALGLLEVGHPVADRLDPGQRGAAGGERAQHHRDEQEAAGVPVRALMPIAADSATGASPADDLATAPSADHREDADHEAVGRDREHAARLLDAAQVHQGQQRRPARPTAPPRAAPADGTAETMLATPAATDTATVST